MKRSHAHFVAVASGEVSAGSDAARDALFHFFQDAYHLKDWLKNDPLVTVAGAEIERAVSEAPNLSMCADLCNGTKHRTLRSSRQKAGPGAVFATQSVTVHVPPGVATVASVGPVGEEVAPGATVTVDAKSVWGPPGFTTHSWTVRTGRADIEAEVLASGVVADWEVWLGRHDLLSPPLNTCVVARVRLAPLRVERGRSDPIHLPAAKSSRSTGGTAPPDSD